MLDQLTFKIFPFIVTARYQDEDTSGIMKAGTYTLYY